jgi:hypothetical protein
MFAWLDKEGNTITPEEWSKLQNDRDYRIIKQEHVGPYWVSTVWLGIYSNIDGEPEIFETMVFNNKDYGEDQWRYTTLEDATAGHERVCEEVRLIMAATT